MIRITKNQKAGDNTLIQIKSALAASRLFVLWVEIAAPARGHPARTGGLAGPVNLASNDRSLLIPTHPPPPTAAPDSERFKTAARKQTKT